MWQVLGELVHAVLFWVDAGNRKEPVGCRVLSLLLAVLCLLTAGYLAYRLIAG
jgi:hypothetical protein